VRFGNVSGGYRITVPPTPTGKFLVTVITPNAANAIARLASYTKNGDGTHSITIEIHDLTGAWVDSDFTFMTTDRS
jgi:hypothetical protein